MLEPETAQLFIQDKMNDKTVDEIATILEELKADLFFKLLQTVGPYRLLTEIKKRHPELTTRESFVGSCDVCLEFTSNPDVAKAASELLMEYADILTEDANAAQESALARA